MSIEICEVAARYGAGPIRRPLIGSGRATTSPRTSRNAANRSESLGASMLFFLLDLTNFTLFSPIYSPVRVCVRARTAGWQCG